MSFTGKPQLTTVNSLLDNDAFWPDITLKEFIENYRVMTEYDDTVIRWALGLAMMRVNQMLDGVKGKAVNPDSACTHDTTPMSYTSLDAWAGLHSQKVDGMENAVRMYKHSVYCTAKAYLLQQFNVMNRRPQAENIKKEAPETEEYWLGQAKTGMVWLCDAIAPCLSADSNFSLVSVSGGGSAYVAVI